MNIIEKLGITPGPWDDRSYSSGNVENIISKSGVNICAFAKKMDATIISAAPEMLEALIEEVLYCDNLGVSRNEKSVKAIEKACYPQTWEEIKDLL